MCEKESLVATIIIIVALIAANKKAVIDPSQFRVMEFDKDAYFEELGRREELAQATLEERLLDLPN